MRLVLLEVNAPVENVEITAAHASAGHHVLASSLARASEFARRADVALRIIRPGSSALRA